MKLATALISLFWAAGCTTHECRREAIVDTTAARDASPCGNADNEVLTDTEDLYFITCEWYCVAYDDECQRVTMTFGYAGGWVQDPEVDTEECKTKADY